MKKEIQEQTTQNSEAHSLGHNRRPALSKLVNMKEMEAFSKTLEKAALKAEIKNKQKISQKPQVPAGVTAGF